MKKLIFSLTGILLLLAAGACSKPGPRSIEMPTIAVTNTEVIDVHGVELTDSATILKFHAKFRPGWWIRIDTASHLVADGKEYAIISADGIVPGEEFTMPESGEADFTISFEPVPFDTKTIDFTEGDGGWSLWGIDVTGAKGDFAAELPDELPKEIRKLDMTEVVADPVLEVAPTQLKFHVLGYNPQFGKKLQVSLMNIGGKDEKQIVELDEQGNGVLDISLCGTTQIGAYLPDILRMNPGYVLVAPGGSTDIYLNPAYAGDYYIYNRSGNEDKKGCNPVRIFDNGRYAALNRHINANDFGIDVFALDIDWHVTPDQYTDKVIAERTAILDSLNAADIPEEVKKYIAATIDVNALDAVLNAEYALSNSFYKEHDSNPADSITIPGAEQFARVADAVDLDNNQLLAVPDFGYVLSEMNSAGYSVESAQVAELANFVKAYRKAAAARLAEPELDKIQGANKPFYTEAAKARQAEAEKAFEAAKTLMTPNPEVADNKQLFDAIVAPYKGKVVLVDLWNTWCAPCRAALAANEPLKTGELANDDIVWLYIADDSSDLAIYASMIPDIKGIHHKVSADQISAIREQFKVDGIPYYILVDRNGKATGHPDFRDHDALVKGVKAAL